MRRAAGGGRPNLHLVAEIAGDDDDSDDLTVDEDDFYADAFEVIE